VFPESLPSCPACMTTGIGFSYCQKMATLISIRMITAKLSATIFFIMAVIIAKYLFLGDYASFFGDFVMLKM